MKAIYILFTVVMYVSSINFKEIELIRQIPQDQQYQRNFFYDLFTKHKSLKSFISQNKYKSNFISKHLNTIKQYFTEYQGLIYRSKYLYELNELPLVNQALNDFIAKIAVGTPPQEFYVLVDTGSSDLWVHDDSFSANKSETFQSDGAAFHIAYGNGSDVDNGYSANDTLSIAGFKIDNFQFAVIPTPNGTLPTPPQGLMGMAFRDLSAARPIQSPSVIERLYHTNQVAEPVFSLFLTKGYNQTGSRLILGGVNPDYFTGQIHYVPVLKRNFYKIKYEGFQIGSQIFPDSETIVDSGTTLIHVHEDTANSIAKLVGDIDPTCSDIDSPKYPIIYVLIDEVKYPLKSSEYIFNSTEVYNKCLLSIAYRGVNFSILGDQFLKVYYSVFDQGNNRVGFAKAIDIQN